MPQNSIRLKILAFVATIFGFALFVYFISEIGLPEIWQAIKKFGFGGFAMIFGIYAVRIAIRSITWTWCVEKPNRLSILTALRAVIMGEAMSSLLPLGILISGTTKALAVKKNMPFVEALSSLAIENLFYSLATGLFITFGAFALIFNFDLPEIWLLAAFLMIALVAGLTILGFVMVIRQWHFASAIANKIYEKQLESARFQIPILVKWLENGRADVRRFEEQIYGFYRREPRLFVPVFLLEAFYHLLGVLEVYILLLFISQTPPTFFLAFLLESISRVIIVFFKLIPFNIGVDQAGAEFITQTLDLKPNLGATMAIVRLGNRIIWVTFGLILIAQSGLKFEHLTNQKQI